MPGWLGAMGRQPAGAAASARSFAVRCCCPILPCCSIASLPCLPADVTSGVNTREKLKERDPRLAELLSKVYGDGSWRYPATAPGKFQPWASSSSGGRQRSRRGGSKQAPSAAAAATTQHHEQQQQQRQVPVLVEQHSNTEPLLHGAGGNGIGGVSRRRRTGSPSRRGGGGCSGSLGVVPRRITRAFALLTGCCFGSL
jgi:hypothetical protein